MKKTEDYTAEEEELIQRSGFAGIRGVNTKPSLMQSKAALAAEERTLRLTSELARAYTTTRNLAQPGEGCLFSSCPWNSSNRAAERTKKIRMNGTSG